MADPARETVEVGGCAAVALPVDTASMRALSTDWKADLTLAEFVHSSEVTLRVAADYIDHLEEALHDARRAEAHWEGRYAEATREQRRRKRAAKAAGRGVFTDDRYQP